MTAVEKIKDEMQKNNTHPYVQAVGKFLLQHLEHNPECAEKIIVADKTIIKSLEAMRKVAEKKKVGNCAVLTDEEGFKVVLEYYGIDTKQTLSVTKVAETVTEPVKSVKNNNFDVKLEDFLK